MCHDRYDIWYRPTETTCLQEQYVPFEAQTTVSFTVNAVPSLSSKKYGPIIAD